MTPGGAEVNAQLLADYLAAHGWDVEVVTGAAVLPRGAAYPIRHAPGLRSRPSIVYEPWWARRTAARLKPLINPDRIVHAFDVLSHGAVAALDYPRTIATVQDISPICGPISGILDDGSLCHGCTAANLGRHVYLQNKRGLGWLARYVRYYTACVKPYRRELLGRFTAVTTISAFLKEYIGLTEASVIPDLLPPPAAACPLDDRRAPTIVSVGRLSYDKGTDLILQALAALPDFCLILVGSGNVERWQAYAEEQGVADRVQFVGRVPTYEALEWYRRADVAVLASRMAEGSSRTVLEAMGAGLAVVAPRFGGPLGLLTDGSTGRLFDRGDVTSLTAAIHRAYEERQSLGARAHEAIKAYAPERVGPKYEALYRALG